MSWEDLRSRFAPVSVAVLNNTQDTIQTLHKTVPAEGRPIPIVYGEAQVGGQIFALDYDSGTWTIGYVICLGEIDSFTAVWINGAAAVSGVTVNTYTGTTSQTQNSLLYNAIGAYADTLVHALPASASVGIAYVVVQYTDEHYQDWPEVVAEIKGLKVWNPKTSTTVYSDNPALHLGDLLSSTVYGAGYTVDDTALEAAQDYCDDTTPTEVRRKSYLVINSVRPTDQWVEVLRAYASVFLAYRGDTVYLIPDKAGSSVMSITAADVVTGSLRIVKRDSSEIPTVVRVSYTDTSEDIWRSRLSDPAKATGVDAGTTPWRESRVNMDGINRHSQAKREAIERLNKLTLSDLEVHWQMFDEGLELEPGDIVSMTHPYGLTSKLLRLTSVRQVSPGRWTMVGLEYDPAAYDDTVASAPTYTDGNLPGVIAPGPPTGLALNETLYQLANDEYASRIDVSWNAPADSLVTGYNVTVKDGSNVVVWSVNTTETSTSTGPMLEGVTYTVYVYAYNTLYTSSTVSDTELIDGKSTAPAAPTGLSGSNNNGVVFLYWTASVDSDVRRYEVRYYTTGQTWGDGTVLDRVDALSFSTDDVADGTWRFGVKAIDSVGLYSSTADEVDIAVSTTDLFKTFYQDAQPSGEGETTGDIWFDTDNFNKQYRYNGSTWDPVSDGRLLDLDGTIRSSGFTAEAGKRYMCNTSGGAFTMTLPASPVQTDVVWFADYARSFDSYWLQIGRNGNKIMGLTEDLYVDLRNYAGGLEYTDTTQGWILVS